MPRALRIALWLGLAACGRSRAPLPPPPAVLVATPEDAFLAAPPARPTTGLPDEPAVETRTLANGLRVLVVERPDLPMVSVFYVCRASGSHDRDVRPGVDELLEDVLGQEGHLHAPSLRGSSEPTLQVLSGGVEIVAQGPSANVGAMIDTMAHMIRAPGYDLETLAPLRHVLLETIAGQSQGSAFMLGVHEREMIFGADDPRAQPWWGTATQFGTIHPEDLAARHAQLFTPSLSALVVVGDTTLDQVEGIASGAFGDWAAPVEATTPLGPAAFPVPHARLHAIPSGNDSASLLVREHAPGPDDPDRPAFEVATALLGGMFSARVNELLREEQGRTYGIHALVRDYRAYSTLEIDLEIPTEHIQSTIGVMIDELRRVGSAGEVGADELARARTSTLASYRARFLSISSTARTLATLFLRDESLAQLFERIRALESVTADDVARAAQRWIRVEGAPMLVTGRYLALMAIRDVPGGSELVVWRF